MVFNGMRLRIFQARVCARFYSLGVFLAMAAGGFKLVSPDHGVEGMWHTLYALLQNVTLFG